MCKFEKETEMSDAEIADYFFRKLRLPIDFDLRKMIPVVEYYISVCKLKENTPEIRRACSILEAVLSIFSKDCTEYAADTCHSIEYLGMPLISEDDGCEDWGKDVKVGIIDMNTNRKYTKDEYSGLHRRPVKYVGYHDCEKETWFSGHGIFCASVIGGRKQDVDLYGVCKGQIRGVAPSCSLYLYGVGCEECGIKRPHIVKAIRQGIKDQLLLISLSLGPKKLGDNPDTFLSDRIGEATLEAFRAGILVCVTAGNKGPLPNTLNFGFPWSLNDGACTSGKVVVTKVEVGVRGPVVKGVKVISEEGDVKVVAVIEGSSLNYMKDTKFHNLVFGKNVRGRDSVVHRVARKNNVGKTTYYMALEAGDYGEAWRASNGICTDHSLTTMQRSDTDRLIEWKQKLGSICVKISTSKFVDDPRGCFVLNTSSRGPSSLYKEFMMPQVVAPGYRMIASWPADLPITEEGSAVKLFNHQTIKTGTSPAVPLVVGGIARVTQVVKKSGWGRQPAALKSATITTATSLKGSIPGNEFAYGAGLVDINKACTPGLIYVETYENYQRFRRGVIKAVELNEPSFAVSFASSNDDSVRVLQRLLTNVDDDGEMTYDRVLTYDAGNLGPKVKVIV